MRIVLIGLVLSVFMFCKPVFSQEYTAKDSASFQKALEGNLSDFNRIDYQLKLAEYSIRKPGSYKADLDNARTMIAKSKVLNVHLRSNEAAGHILFAEAYLEQETGFSPKGKALISAAIALLEKGNDKYILATAYNALAGYYDFDKSSELNVKVDLIKKSAALYEQGGNKLKAAATLQYLADLYTGYDDQKGLKIIKESLAIYNSIHYPKLQGLYDLWAQVCVDSADYKAALNYEFKAMKISEQFKDTSMQACEINNHLGIILLDIRDLKFAMVSFKTALKIAQRNNDIAAITSVTFNMVNVYILLSETKKALNTLDNFNRTYKLPQNDYAIANRDQKYLIILSRLKQFDRARTYATELLRLSNSPSLTPNEVSSVGISLIVYYDLIKDYKNELIIIQKNQKRAQKSSDRSLIVENMSSWYRLDSSRADYKLAFYHLLDYKRLSDSVFSEKQKQQINNLQVEYGAAKKEAEIERSKQDIKILTQAAKLNEAKLSQAQFTRNVTLAGIMLFIVITGMQYRRYNEKQKVNLLITDKNAALQKLVTEKEWLLKEVHHRVKNNLHTVICLLESQASFLENDALKALESSQHRIYAMSLIHQRLYQSTDIQTIDMAVYLPEFLLYLKECFGSPANIIFQQEIGSVRLDVSQAIPLALIVNEAVTNSIKYAFPDGRLGLIRVVLLYQEDSINLSIEDNGIGMPENIKPEQLTSLGLELIRGLTDDLKGTVQFIVENGTRIIICFEKAPISGS